MRFETIVRFKEWVFGNGSTVGLYVAAFVLLLVLARILRIITHRHLFFGTGLAFGFLSLFCGLVAAAMPFVGQGPLSIACMAGCATFGCLCLVFMSAVRSV